MSLLAVFLVIFAAGSIFKISTWISHRWLYQRHRDQLGCREAQGKFPHTDPILGLDFMLKSKRERDSSTHRAGLLQLCKAYGKTHSVVFAGKRMVRTIDSKNVQSILVLDQKYYGLEPFRSGLAEPLFDRGVNTTDGQYWRWSRDILKPTFSRQDVCDLAIREAHFQDLLAVLPSDGSVVDLQPLFSKLFLDTSTGLLFGEPARTLNTTPDLEAEKFVENFDKYITGLGNRVRLGPLKFLHQDRAWYKAIRDIHTYIQRHIDRAFLLDSYGIEKQKGIEAKEHRHVLLDDIIKQCKDLKEVRSQLLAVFMPSRDTLVYLASNVVWAFSRYPEVAMKLRAEVLTLKGQVPSYEALRSLKYLHWMINEAHRMWPVSSAVPRVVLDDVVLPTGGGSDGFSPILMKKGEFAWIDQYSLHHDVDYWGADHDQYRPERWEGLRPFWNFVPFGGGPRTCPAQHLVNTEAAYMVVRLLQEYETIEAADSLPWTENWHISMSNKHGCKVKLSKTARV